MEFEAQWTETPTCEIQIQIDTYSAKITDTKYQNYIVDDPNMNYVINAARSVKNDNIRLNNNDTSGLFNTSYPANYHIAQIVIEFGSNKDEKLAIVLSNTELTMTDVYEITPYKTYEGIGDDIAITLSSGEIDNNYQYFGIRSNGGVIYVKSITIVWEHD